MGKREFSKANAIAESGLFSRVVNKIFIPASLLKTAFDVLTIPWEKNCIKDTTGQKTWIGDM